MSRYIAVSADFWKDLDFRDGEMTQREAFLWLVAEASWKPREKRIGSKVIQLDRGQLAASTRFLAEAFGWSEARVRRYLDMLKNRRIADAASDAGVTVITIRNYDKYQSGAPRSDAPRDEKPTQQRRTSDANEYQEDTKGIPEESLSSGPDEADVERIWALWPQPGRARSSKKKVRSELGRRLKAGARIEDVLRGARLFAGSADAQKEGGRFVPALDRWIRDERWEAMLEAPRPAPDVRRRPSNYGDDPNPNTLLFG